MENPLSWVHPGFSVFAGEGQVIDSIEGGVVGATGLEFEGSNRTESHPTLPNSIETPVSEPARKSRKLHKTP